MNEEWYARTELLLGSEAIEKLSRAHVLVAGLGGVGSMAAELLCRAGVGKLSLVDNDRVQASNRNRQIIAGLSTEGQRKTEVVSRRLVDINPDVVLNLIDTYLIDDSIHDVLNRGPYDYVVDAIDTLSPKVFFVYHTLAHGFPLVSAMGSGGKVNPAQVRLADIDETYNDRLAKYMRKHLHKLGVKTGFQAVFSPEQVNKGRILRGAAGDNKNSITGTVSYMPIVFACYCASAVVRGLT